MELTPEERERIYEEEKARRAAVEKFRGMSKFRIPDDQRATREYKQGRPKGFLVSLVFGVGLLFLAGTMLNGINEAVGPRFDRDSATSAVEHSSAIAQLKEARVIDSIGFFDSGLYVNVGASFYLISFEQKTDAIRQIALAVGFSNGGDHFVLYDWRDNRKIGAWRGEDGLHLDR